LQDVQRIDGLNDERYVKEATDSVANVLLQRQVTVTPSRIDKFGTFYGTLKEGTDLDLSPWLVLQGFAMARPEATADLIALQEGARLAQTGLWKHAVAKTEFPANTPADLSPVFEEM
jgi:endonuclease YncB( thermonuclease family)